MDRHEARAAGRDGDVVRGDRRDFLKAAAALAAAGAMPGRAGAAEIRDEVDAFLKDYTTRWLPLETKAGEAAWAASTDVSEAHTAAQVAANQAVNQVVGSPEVIDKTARFLREKDRLTELQVRQLEKVRLRSAEAPGTLPEVVKARVEAEAKQSATQDAFAYTVKKADGSVENPSANRIDQVLLTSKDLDERKAYWEASKEIGAPLREGILKLRDLRNKVARELGFADFFALQVADYGMSVDEMLALCDRIVADVRPLYAQLHTWAKHQLARRYGVEAPDGAIPAHWLSNRWGQNWPGFVEGVDMDAPFRGKPREFITEQAERFYTSMGFPKLPPSFWSRSDLYPADPASGRKKNSHASAWHIDLDQDVRSLMSIEPDNQWFDTAHHELGHIYYFLSYARPEVPPLLRQGANRAFHEGVGDLIGLAAGQRPYLKQVGLLTPEAEAAPATTFLLSSALEGSSIVFLPWSAGVMTRFERDFYAGTIADDSLNAGWWERVGKYQGIAPPGERPETLCDAATKTHINDDPAQYYDYAIGTVLKFQLHDHIAREILKQDPRECNYFGNAKVGDFLRSILRLGATRDWNAVLREATGEGLTARPLVAYFEPLREWLEVENKGRASGWPQDPGKP
ncbi:M2 family metallopeptidase [Planctomyces sp. SH-PL62]|uniref:M2 family metallopeptidase n=1 Tax=Planctomyces sp. SH-PL62 TaxID=1636152 RepID=UPI00078DEE4A|nr:M2 family metallopeptidase [Planctomyces sp. SH-PL62]AMV39173.1 Angiotensin-converting enzyme [Planctomyces sp. SH-PL62]